MKFTFSWLKDHLETNATPQDIAEALTHLGLEVEKITEKGKDLAAFFVGHVLTTTPHPNADRLQVCTVATHQGKRQIVCGAPNARPGLFVAVAFPGTYVPGIDVTLKVATIRGVESQGMLCSAQELCLNSSHDGILELDEHPLGTPLAKALGLDDPVFEIKLTPNRPDCTAVRGIARDLSAKGLGRLLPLPDYKKPSGKNPPLITLEQECGCSFFTGLVISGVHNGKSPAWMAKRLEAIGSTPRGILIDVTNYFCFDLGRPLHAFDANKLTLPLCIRRGKKGETLLALNDETYVLDEETCIVADEKGPLALGGIIGGKMSAIDEHSQTVFLESAYFSPSTVAKTGRKLRVQSDARYRFERGCDPLLVQEGLERAAAMIIDLCGSGLASTPRVVGSLPHTTRRIPFDRKLLFSLGGIRVEAKKTDEILQNLGFTLDGADVLPPSFRPDIEGPADLVEEVARLVGYDKIETVPLKPLPKVSSSVCGNHMRAILAPRGFIETVTWSFMSSAHAKLLGSLEEQYLLQNPISQDLNYLRPTAIINGLQALETNAKNGFCNLSFFEIGPVFLKGTEEHVASAVRSGQTERHWQEKSRPLDFFDIKADVMAVFAALMIQPSSIEAETSPLFHPKRSAVFKLGKTVLARCGEVHPQLVEALKLKKAAPYLACELFFERFPLKSKKKRAPFLPSALQPVSRDFAFVVDKAVLSGDLVRAAKATNPLIAAVTVFDHFEGPTLGDGKKSLAFNVVFQAKDETLKDEQIDAMSAKITQAIDTLCGGHLR